MRKVFFLASLLCSMWVFAQDMEAIINGERAAFEAKKNFKFKRSGQEYNLTYQQLNLTIDPGVRYINGSVYSELIAQEPNFTQAILKLMKDDDDYKPSKNSPIWGVDLMLP